MKRADFWMRMEDAVSMRTVREYAGSSRLAGIMRQTHRESARFGIFCRRKADAGWAGLAEVPAVIRELDDDQAIVAMVDSVRP